jgi:hypothetical protein
MGSLGVYMSWFQITIQQNDAPDSGYRDASSLVCTTDASMDRIKHEGGSPIDSAQGPRVRFALSCSLIVYILCIIVDLSSTRSLCYHSDLADPLSTSPLFQYPVRYLSPDVCSKSTHESWTLRPRCRAGSVGMQPNCGGDTALACSKLTSQNHSPDPTPPVLPNVA